MIILENTYPIYKKTRCKKRFEHLGVPCDDKYFYPNCTQLTDGSNVLEERICDRCGKHCFRTHQKWLIMFDEYGEDICQECYENSEEIKNIIVEKRKVTCLKNNGTEFPMQGEEVRQKAAETFNQNYENGHPLRDPKVREKVRETNNIRYGVDNPMQNKEIVEKLKNNMIEKYGESNVMRIPQFREKIEKTCEERYGGPCSFYSEEIREKARQTMQNNGTVATSSQQLKIYELLQSAFSDCEIELNKQVSHCSLDISLNYNDVLIDIEYDGQYWHQDAQRDRRRDEIIKTYGYKVLRIKSRRLVPTLDQLKTKIIDFANSTHSYSEIILEDYNK